MPLAVQTVLSDVFASLSIGFDKPFEIGDFVVFNDVAGTIEHIGLKTTRIRSLSGEQIVCANAQLLQQTIHNYKRMQTRRIVFTFGVATATPPEKLRLIGDMVKKIITDVGETQFDRAHLLAFGQDRLTYEVVHIVNTADYNKYMDIQQEINIRIIEKLIENDIELALPSLVVRAPVQVEETGDYSDTADAKTQINASYSKISADNTGNSWVPGALTTTRQCGETTCGYSTCKWRVQT